ncbi:hypothetical protein OBBRIDRAFT_795862, partial [Obba rivulosa]
MGETLDFGFDPAIPDADVDVTDGDSTREGGSASPYEASYAHSREGNIEKGMVRNVSLPSDEVQIPATSCSLLADGIDLKNADTTGRSNHGSADN